MDLVKSLLKKDEKILHKTKVSSWIIFKRKMFAMLPMIIMWVLVDIFFLYLITLEEISGEYWFVSIPIVSYNVIGLVAIYISISKSLFYLSSVGYVFTNLGIYKYNVGPLKNVDVIYFENLTDIDKIQRTNHEIIIRSATKSIVLENFNDLKDWYSLIVKKIQNKQEQQSSANIEEEI